MELHRLAVSIYSVAKGIRPTDIGCRFPLTPMPLSDTRCRFHCQFRGAGSGLEALALVAPRPAWRDSRHQAEVGGPAVLTC
jgi:hypothetical protein